MKGFLDHIVNLADLNPRATLHGFNAVATFQRNDTAPFMNKNFDEDDHKFVMKMGRELDESGIEKYAKIMW